MTGLASDLGLKSTGRTVVSEVADGSKIVFPVAGSAGAS
jgi:hypothetical protein